MRSCIAGEPDTNGLALRVAYRGGLGPMTRVTSGLPSSAPIGIWRPARITHPYGERYIQTALRQLQHS
jgi:hypothetical protein